jgi:hypothetical protein
MRRSVGVGGGHPHSWHTYIEILCLYRFVDTCGSCGACWILDENRRSGCGCVASVSSCVRRRERASPLAVGDTRGGLSFDGIWCVVGGRAAFRLAAYPYSEAAGVTCLRSARRTERRQSFILCLRLPIDGNIGIGIFPQGQKSSYAFRAASMSPLKLSALAS